MKKCLIGNKLPNSRKYKHFNSLLQVECFLDQLTRITETYCATKKIRKLCSKNNKLYH